LKKKFVSCHENLNKLRVKLATCKDTSLVRLPPNEPSLYQHVLRASLQTKIWLSSNIGKPPSLSPCNYRWRKDAAGPLPVFFEGIMTSDFLQDLICSYTGKVMSGRSCICNEQNMCCTELCLCHGSDFCMNPFFEIERKWQRFWRRRGKRCRLLGFFIIILLLNEITYDFFSLSCVNAFLSSTYFIVIQNKTNG
jgi:hypothetical protein